MLCNITLLSPVTINSDKSSFQITLLRFSVVPDVLVDQVAPSSFDVNITPVFPTATNNDRLLEYVASINKSVPVLTSTQLLALILVNIVPFSPNITIEVVLDVTALNVSIEPVGVLSVQVIPSKLRNTTLLVIVGITL